MADSIGSRADRPRIFISYRRADTSAHAGRLYDALVERFGEDRVFMDVDTVPVGTDFSDVISQAIARCDVVIALFGQTWATATDKKGNRRIDSPDDLVRLELEEALRQNLKVLPILVQGAEMPAAEDLPAPLAPLVRRHAFEMLDRRWRSDLAELLSVLETLGPEKPELTGVQALREVGARARSEVERPGRAYPPPASTRRQREIAVELLPPTSSGRRRGKQRLTVTNEGDRSLLVEVVGEDPDLLLEVVASPSHLFVEPGTSATSWLHVRPRHVLWRGPTETLLLRVTALAEDAEPVTVETIFAQRPVFSPWSRRALLWPAGLAVVAMLLVLRPWVRPPKPAQVPDCQAPVLVEARCTQLLDIVGLNAQVRREPSATAPAEVVLRVEPPAGTILKKGTSVVVTVSDGLRIPVDIVGRAEEDAVDVLTRLGLQPSVTNEQGVQGGLVSRTIPPPGTVVLTGDRVEVVVVAAVTSTSVPAGSSGPPTTAGVSTTRG